MGDYLGRLNAVQHKAVTNDAQYLQILAGPGSGKTRVLTSRVAYAVKQLHHHPRRIVVVTFTNKAAREMRSRLQAKELLGMETSNALFMGTFHSVCGRLLRRHPERIDLKKNFLIADTDMSKFLIKKLKIELKPHLSEFAMSKLTPDAFYNEISKHKNMGMKVEDYVEKYRDEFTKRDYIKMFVAYENRLKAENLVDFDNLLLLARDLLRTSPQVADFIQHVLVDEFQDTNAVQYDIVKLLTAGRTNYLTICGDPDQSIFGWRCAVKENFIKMQEDYPNCQVENLEQNYRSTENILKSAFSVITQDEDRIEKALSTDNCKGAPTSLLRMANDMLEAQSIAEEINRIIKFSNGLITYSDIAVLVRMNFLSRSLEQTFHAAGIPYVIVGGVQFFEREEIKDIIAYLRVIYNPNDTTAFERIINKPRRGIGEVTLDRIQKMSLRKDWDVIRVLEEVAQGNAYLSVSGKVKNNVRQFITMYHDVRQMMMNKEPVSAMISHIVNAIDYKTFLNNTHDKGGESRWDNVGELITLAKQSFDGRGGPTQVDFSSSQPKENEIAAVINDLFPDELSDSSTEDGLSDPDNSQHSEKPTLPVRDHPLVAQAVRDHGEEDVDRVALFLESTSLESSQGNDEDEEEEGNKSSRVTISTLHSAKGLEWPVVFIMGCEDKFIPHVKGDINEEIRLLYVGMTRAQCFLYCTHAHERTSWGKLEEREQSSFLRKIPKEIYTKNTPQWNQTTRAWVADMLGRTEKEPSEKLSDDGQMIWLPERTTAGKYGSRSYGGRNDERTMGSWCPGGNAKARVQQKSAALAKPVKMSNEQAMASPYASFGSASQLLGSPSSSSNAFMTKQNRADESSELYSYAYVKTDPDAAALNTQMHKHAKRSSAPLLRQTKKKK